MLKQDTIDALPEDLDVKRIEKSVAMDTGLGVGWGQVAFLLWDGECVVLARGSRLEEFRRVKTPLGSLPKVYDSGWEVAVLVTSERDGTQSIPVYALDRTEVFAFFDEVYTRFMEWSGLVTLLQIQAKYTELVEEQKAILLRLGDLYNEDFDDPEKALGWYVAALKLDLEDAETLDAVEALVEDEPTQNTEYLELLARAYERQGKQDQWVDITQNLARTTKDLGERAALYRRLCGVLRRDPQGDAARAFSFELQAFQADHGGDATTRAVRIQSLVSSARDHDLVDKLVVGLGSLHFGDEDSPYAALVYRKLAALCEEDLANPKESLFYIEKALILEPKHRATLEHAVRLTGQHADHEKQAVYLQTLIEETPQRLDRLALLKKLASLQVQALHKPDSAIQTYRICLRLDSSDRDSMLALASLLEDSGEYDEARSLLQRAARDVSDDERLALLRRAVDDTAHAAPEVRLEALEELRAASPDHPSLLFEIAEILGTLERWYERLKTLEALEHYDLSPQDTKRALSERAETLSGPLHQPERAYPLWIKVLEINSRHEGALRALCAYFKTRDTREEVAYLDRLASLQHLSTEERWDLRRERAHLLSDRLHEFEAAAETLEKYCSAHPDDHQAEHDLARLYMRLGRAHDSERLMIRGAQALEVDDPVQARKMLYQVAEAARQRGGYSAYLRVLLEAVGTRPQDWDQALFLRIRNALYDLKWWGVWEDVLLLRACSLQGEDAWNLWLEVLQTGRKKHDGDSWELGVWCAQRRRGLRSETLEIFLQEDDLEHVAQLQPPLEVTASLDRSWAMYFLDRADARERMQRASFELGDLRRWVAFHASLVERIRTGEDELYTRQGPISPEEGHAWLDEAIARAKRVSDELTTIQGAYWLAQRLDGEAARPKDAFHLLEEALRQDPHHAHVEAQVFMRVLARRLGDWGYVVEHLERDLTAANNDVSAREAIYVELLEIFTEHAPDPQRATEIRAKLQTIEGAGDWLWAIGLGVIGVCVLSFVLLYSISSTY